MSCTTNRPMGHTMFVALLFPAIVGQVHAQQSPDESLATLHAAEGVEVSLWASEPMVNNPTSMDIDSRGRVWISEGLNYRMKQRQFETMGRVDGADRIKILSDTDGDGKADSVTVFADAVFPVPLGLAVEELWKDGRQTGTRVYVGNSPDFLVLEDNDGDDKADRRYALLTGFHGVDSDHGLHGMTFGPDGKLYFTVGDARYGADQVQSREKTFDVTDRSGRRLSCSNFGTTLRVNRDGTQLEVLSSGHRNNYEAAVDAFGNVFGSDNDDDGNRGARMYWVMDGGQYGYQRPDSSRHWAEELPGIIPKLVGTGNGAPGGLTVYEGDLLPERCFGAVLQVDSGTRQVNSHILHRHGAGFRSGYEVLLRGDDPWFRPVDLAVGPDGSVLICDWYDAGVGGNRFSDQTTGRIYRLSNSSAQHDSTRFDGTDVISALNSPNPATRLAARDMLVAQGEEHRPRLLTLFRDGQPRERARALHLLHALPQTGVSDTIAALSDSDPRIRETAVQLLARDASRESLVEAAASQLTEPPATQFLNQILPLADDPDAGVRRAVAMSLRNVPTEDAGAALETLAGSWDGADRYYLEAIRAALINRSPQYLGQLLDRLTTRAIETGWNNELVAAPPYYPIGTNDAFLRPEDQLPPANAASRVIGLAWALERSESLPALTRLLARNSSSAIEQAAMIALSVIHDEAAGRLLTERFFVSEVDDDTKGAILRRLGAGIAGPWSTLATDPSLNRVFSAALDSPSLQSTAIESIALCGLTGFGERLLHLARDESSSHEVRAAAIRGLGRLRYSPAHELAADLVNGARGKSSGGPMALTALNASYALAAEGGTQFLTTTLADSEMPLDVRRLSLQLLAVSMSGVERILRLRQDDSFPEDLESELAFLLHNHADRSIRRIAESVLPVSSSNTTKKLHSADSVLGLTGDASRGRRLFESHKDAACARCHRVTGEGSLVGPDLASIGMKYGERELLYHIQNPSGSINYSFVAHSFVLEDGRVLTGLVTDRKDGQVTIGMATGQRVTFAAGDVEDEVPQSISLMPEGLVSGLTSQEVADLIEYLLSLRQGDAGQARRQQVRPEVRNADIIVYGATPGGFCAAIAAAREGSSVILLEPTSHAGGVNTGGLSFSDSNQTVRSTMMGLFDEWHTRIEQDYRNRGIELNYSVSTKDNAKWTYEPHVAARVTRQMLDEANVEVLTNRALKSVATEGTRITSLETSNGTFTARVFIDTTYEGDLMAAAGVRWTIGREGRKEFGESLAGKQYPKRRMAISGFDDEGEPLPLITTVDAGRDDEGDSNVMVYSFRLCLTGEPENRVPFPPPNNYDPERFEVVRRYYTEARRPVLLWDLYPLPGNKFDANNGIGKQFSMGLVGGCNGWSEAGAEDRRAMWETHRQYTLELYHFLTTDPAVPKHLRDQLARLGLCRDEFPEHGHWSPQLYVREGRRMKGMYVVSQKDIMDQPEKPDPIVVSSFPIDSHDCQRVALNDGGVINEGTIFPVRMKRRRHGYPYHIPYRAILPRPDECDNLLVPVALSCTHVAFSSVRVEPTWMILGQSAGIAAALAADEDVPVQKLPYAQLRRELLAQGQVLDLPTLAELPPVPKRQVSIDPATLPGIVLDDSVAELKGRWPRSTNFKPHIGTGYVHDDTRADGNSVATFRFTVPRTGRYELRMAYSAHHTRSTNVPVIVQCGRYTTELTVNQTTPLPSGKPFRRIGEVELTAEAETVITVSNAGTDGFVILDAFQLLPMITQPAPTTQ